MRFVEIGRTLGKPVGTRMNLNQQSPGSFWQVHKNLMRSTSPIVDCGVHYVDIMCQVTRAKPVAVHAVGARLTDEIASTMVNYGHLHLTFDDGSVGWYECGWGPMISETAFFVKDMIGPKGCVSIVSKEETDVGVNSSDHDSHTRTNALRIHHAGLKADGSFAHPDEIESTKDEPGHQELCEREQRLFLKAIRGEIDLSEHLEDAINSLRIVFAADESTQTHRGGETVTPPKQPSALTFATETSPSEATIRAIESGLTAYATGIGLKTDWSPRWIIGRRLRWSRSGWNSLRAGVRVAVRQLAVGCGLRIAFIWSARSSWPARKAAARAQGCCVRYLDTFTFQAPKLYERLGYREFGRLNDFPPGHARIWFSKALG